MKKIISCGVWFCLILICLIMFKEFVLANEYEQSEYTLYQFEAVNEEGDVVYDQKSPIIVNGSEIKLKREYQSFKEMFRGVWIATISNINFPKNQECTYNELIEEFNVILDRVQELNLNAIFFQVSPELDAFYESDFRPWSKYLTGTQGNEPVYNREGKDFLSYAINETRRRGIEFHAWFNPYRVTKEPHLNKSKEEILETLSLNNFARKNADTVYLFDGKLFLDPGRVEVIKFIKDTILEFITKYDVDGIHFDDYFYPYGSQTLIIDGRSKMFKFGDRDEDLNTYKINSRGIEDIRDWRRDNVNVLMREIRNLISHYNFVNKKSIEWGVSPFGIYAHKGEEFKDGLKTGNLKVGSNTPYGSLSSYRDIYADSLYWIKNNLIDYIVPQIYWPFGKKEAPYEELVSFWSNAVKGEKTRLYIGHGNYCVGGTKGEKKWNNPDEIINQIKFNSKYDNIYGSCFFSINDLRKEATENKNSRVYNKYIRLLEKEVLLNKALVPQKPWLDFMVTKSIYDVNILLGENKYHVFFRDNVDNDSKFYVVYGFSNKDEIDFDNSKNILNVSGRNFLSEFQSLEFDKNEEINVVSIWIKDRAGMELNCGVYDLKTLQKIL